MKDNISEKIRSFMGCIKFYIESKGFSIDGFLSSIKLEDKCQINQEALIKIIEATGIEKSMFNPFRINDQFKKVSANINIQKFKQIFQSMTKEGISSQNLVQKDTVKSQKQLKESSKLEEMKKPQIQMMKESQKQKVADHLKKVIKYMPDQSRQIIKPLKEDTKKLENKRIQSVFEDQTIGYVVQKIKTLLTSDSKALENLFKQTSLENIIFIKKADLKILLSNIGIECLRNGVLLESLIALIMKKERISKYEFEVFFDEYGKKQPKNVTNQQIKSNDKQKQPEKPSSNLKAKQETNIIKEPVNNTPLIEQKVSKQIQKDNAAKKSISISTQTIKEPPIQIKQQKKQIIKEQKNVQIEFKTQTIEKQDKKNQNKIKSQTNIPTRRDNRNKQVKNDSFLKEKNQKSSCSKLGKPETRQGLRKFSSSQQKSMLFTKNKLNSKMQVKKQVKDKFLLASHYFRLNTHSTKEEKDCMVKLQELLKIRKQFVDNSNPQTILKSQVYTPVNNTFAEKQYIVVSKSANEPISNQNIGSQHVIQGQLGNCYFVSVLATLAAIHPKKISQLILFQANPSNYLAVKLFIDGQWRIIETDNRFACFDDRVCFSKSFKNQIWGMLLEKSFAKVYGSYKDIEAGSPLQSFFVLTGAPCEQYYYKNEKVQVAELVKVLKSHLSEGYLMGASVNKSVQNQTKESLEKKGLVMNHAYSLLDVIQIYNKLYVKMRNPWSNEVIWKGSWGQFSKSFSYQTKAKLNFEIEQKNGIFFMQWKYFYKYFDQVSICQINPDFYHTTLKLNFNKRKSNYVKLTISKEGTYNIFICQQFERKYKRSNPNFELSDMRLMIMMRDQKGQLTYISSKNTRSQQVCCQNLYLESGVYIISAKVTWKTWQNYQATLVSYGVDKVAFEPITNRKIVPAFKSSIIEGYISNNKKKQDSHTCIGQKKSGVTEHRYFNLKQALGYMRIVNNSAQTYKLKYGFQLKGMKVIKPRQNEVIFELKPNQEQKIGFFISAGQYFFNYSIAII